MYVFDLVTFYNHLLGELIVKTVRRYLVIQINTQSACQRSADENKIHTLMYVRILHYHFSLIITIII